VLAFLESAGSTVDDGVEHTATTEFASDAYERMVTFTRARPTFCISKVFTTRCWERSL
jgi:hypothetical protein